MNKRVRTLARLKLSGACRDNPDLPRKFVLSMLISMYEADEAIRGGFLGVDATEDYVKIYCKDAEDMFRKLGI